MSERISHWLSVTVSVLYFIYSYNDTNYLKGDNGKIIIEIHTAKSGTITHTWKLMYLLAQKRQNPGPRSGLGTIARLCSNKKKQRCGIK